MTNENSNNVSVIDTTAIPPAVIATLPVGMQPYGVAITPNGARACVANQGSQSVSVIDNTTTPLPTVLTTVPTGPVGRPTGLQPSGVAPVAIAVPSLSGAASYVR